MQTLYRDEYVYFGFTSDGALHLASMVDGYGIPGYLGDPNAPLIEQYGELHGIICQAVAKLYTVCDRAGDRKAILIANRLIDGMREAHKEMLTRLANSGYAPNTCAAYIRLCEERPEGYRLAWRIHN